MNADKKSRVIRVNRRSSAASIVNTEVPRLQAGYRISFPVRNGDVERNGNTGKRTVSARMFALFCRTLAPSRAVKR